MITYAGTSPKNVKMLAPSSAPATRAESVVVRETLSALISVARRHGFGDQRAAHAEVGGADQSHQGRHDQHRERADRVEQREREQRAGEHRVGGAHPKQ
jgi:hypothetical protein